MRPLGWQRDECVERPNLPGASRDMQGNEGPVLLQVLF